MIFLAKLVTLLTTSIMDNNVYIFLHITLVTSLSTVDLMPNFSESNYICPYYKWYNICSDSTNSYTALRIIMQTFDKKIMLHHYPALGKVQLPISCLDDVLAW